MTAFTALFGALASTLAPVATTAAATTAAAAAVPAATLGAVAPAATELGAIAASTTGATGGMAGAIGSTGSFLGETGVAASEGAITETAAVGAGEAAKSGAGTIFTPGNLVRGASSVISQGMQYKNQVAAQQAQEKAQEAQGKMASLRARNARLDALAISRMNIGNIQAAAGAMGAGGQTSSLRGAEASQQTGLAKQWGESRSLEGLAATAGTQLQKASNFGNAAAGWQMAGNLVNKTVAPTIFQTTKNPTANLSTNTIDW